MLFHLACIIMLAAALVVCLFLPYLPGEYDGLAAGLSTMTMLFGFAGVILVTEGVCWLLYEIKQSRTIGAARTTARADYYFAVAAFACALPVAALVAIGALVTLGASAAVIFLSLAAYAAWRVLPKLRELKNRKIAGFNPAPLYLVTLPLTVLAALYVFGDRAAEFSRRRAIANSAPLIDDIEAYRDSYGKYPQSLFSEVEDYKPLVRGITRYQYEPSGDAYNVIFEQFSIAFGTREFVAYNKQDKQEVTAHNIDRLQVAPESIRRGYHATFDAGVPHWKVFLFD